VTAFEVRRVLDRKAELGEGARWLLDLQIVMPVLGPKCVSFGGPALSTLYIMSGRIEHLFERPVSELGDLFAVETRFRGLPETPCGGRARYLNGGGAACV
jgi:hypothetical protein